MTSPIPGGFHSPTPHLVATDGAAAIEFCKKAFGAQEQMRIQMPGTTTLMRDGADCRQHQSPFRQSAADRKVLIAEVLRSGRMGIH